MKKLFFIIAIAILAACAPSAHRQIIWQEKNQLIENSAKLQVGDILITPKDWRDPISWWGHSAIIVNADKEIGEYPKLGYGYFQTPFYHWLKNHPQVSVLRYRHISQAFREKLKTNNQQLSQYDYGILTSKADLQNTNQISLYCSSYIWYLYAKSAADLNETLDIDGNGGYWIMPYDFLQTPQLQPLKDIN